MSVARPTIELRQVSKRYGDHAAVADLDLAVAPGEVLGLLGPNGAGKTTLIRLLTGFVRPTSGSIRVLGFEMADGRAALQARRELGFVPDVAGLDPGMSGEALLDDLARLHGRPPIDRDATVSALDLAAPDLRRPIGRLSRGTRQKINILQGLQHRPALLVLDEPTEGLDPLSKRALFDLLQAAKKRGATILFSSHVLSEVEQLCDRVALIRAGRLVAVDRIDELRRHMRSRVRVRLGASAPVDAPARLAALSADGQLGRDGDRITFAASDAQGLLRTLADMPVSDLTIEPPSLEDIFLHHYLPEQPERHV